MYGDVIQKYPDFYDWSWDFYDWSWDFCDRYKVGPHRRKKQSMKPI